MLDKSTWPEHLQDIRFGEREIKRLCIRFSVPEEPAILRMRAYVDGDQDPESLSNLQRAINT